MTDRLEQRPPACGVARKVSSNEKARALKRIERIHTLLTAGLWAEEPQFKEAAALMWHARTCSISWDALNAASEAYESLPSPLRRYIEGGGAVSDLWDRYDEVSDLSRHVEAALPEGHPLRKLFAMALGVADDTLPDPDMIEAARLHFYGLPEAEQRRILNGWKPEPSRPEAPAVRDWLRDATAKPVLIFTSNAAFPCETYALRCFTPRIDSLPVTMEILAGTTKATAVAAIRGILDLVQRRWPELIDGHEFSGGEPVNKKSGHLFSDATDPTPGRVSGTVQGNAGAAL